MNLQNAINKGYTMKFSPPNLRFVIGKLKAVQEMIGLDQGCFLTTSKNDIELTVQTVDGIFNMLDDISQEIEEIAEKEVAMQIDDAPEPEEEGQDKRNAPEQALASEDSEASDKNVNLSA